MGTEQLEDNTFKLEFTWADIDEIGDMKVYPTDVKRLPAQGFHGVKHFVYSEY